MRPGTFTDLADGRVRLDFPGAEPRCFASRKSAYNARARLERGESRPRCDLYSAREVERLRACWGRASREAIAAMFPGRSIEALQYKARTLKIRSPRFKGCAPWSLDELLIIRRLYVDDSKACAAALPHRSKEAVQKKADRLGLTTKRKAWSTTEMRELRRVMGGLAALAKLGRSRKHVADKIAVVSRQEARFDDMLSAVDRAVPAGLPSYVRDDVKQSLLLGLLGREFTLDCLPMKARRAITDTYGPRMLSLDAPVSDGSSMAWIDTIEADRPHW